MPEEEKSSRIPIIHWFHIPIQIIVAAFCIYWYRHLPPPNKAVLFLGGVAAIMALAEMRPLHKAFYFLLIVSLIFTENRAIDKDRRNFATADDARHKEENRQFKDIADSITAGMKKESTHFDNTMHQFEVENKTLAQMREQTKEVEQQGLKVPLVTLSSKELVAKAKTIAQQMRDYLNNYQWRDQTESVRYFDLIESQGSRITAQQRQQWTDEGDKARADLAVEYQKGATDLVATANLFRIEMLKHVLDRLPDDTQNASWFEHAGPSPLFELSQHADYLDRLALRVGP
jgi:hypothetical protein